MLLNDALLADDCHCKIPLDPLTVSSVALVPSQTDAPPLIVPAFDAVLMSTCTVNASLSQPFTFGVTV